MGKNSYVVPATQELIDQLKGKLRIADEIECQALCGLSADDALQDGFEKSLQSWVGMMDEEPILAFGVASPALISDTGIPWMLATDNISKVGMAVIRRSKKYVRAMLDLFPKLENFVDAENAVSIRWLAWCGFMIAPPMPLRPDGRPFHHFWMEG